MVGGACLPGMRGFESTAPAIAKRVMREATTGAIIII